MPPRAATLPLLLLDGSWDEALDLTWVTRRRGTPLERPMANAVLGQMAYYQGDHEIAWAMVRELLPRGPDSEPEDGLFPYTVKMLRLATRLCLDEGDLASVVRWLNTHDYWLAWSGSVRGRAEAALLRGRMYLLQGDLESAEACGREAQRLATEPRQPLVLIDIHQLLGEIAIIGERFEDAEQESMLALELARACAAPYQLAAVLVCLAKLYLRTGQPEKARTTLGEAHEIAGSLGARPLLETIEELGGSVHAASASTTLTSRELEVLRWVARGLTDAEVADRLYISPRTVGQHLRSIYNKLGVPSRAAATRVAIEDRLI